jgi:hypothetical protein
VSSLPQIHTCLKAALPGFNHGAGDVEDACWKLLGELLCLQAPSPLSPHVTSLLPHVVPLQQHAMPLPKKTTPAPPHDTLYPPPPPPP